MISYDPATAMQFTHTPSPTPCIAVVLFFSLNRPSERELEDFRKHLLRHGRIGREHAVGVE